MRIILILVLPLFIGACKQKKPTVSVVRAKDFVLVDTSEPAREYLQDSDDIDFPIYYIGPPRDTLRIGKRYWYGSIPGTVVPKGTVWSRTYSDQNLQIRVDTSFVTNRIRAYFMKDGSIDPDSSRYYYASMVTIKNISDSVIFMGFTHSVYYLHREFKNRQGQWIKMGSSLHELSLCLTIEPTIYLQPGEVMLSKMAQYQGSFVTDCRLAFGRKEGTKVYSPVFRAAIDERLFQEVRVN